MRGPIHNEIPSAVRMLTMARNERYSNRRKNEKYGWSSSASQIIMQISP
ncbi:Uncharacterised protein [Vibrio cholerae]|nr:Uncharacterised protein [Vibrio cholerae]